MKKVSLFLSLSLLRSTHDHFLRVYQRGSVAYTSSYVILTIATLAERALVKQWRVLIDFGNPRDTSSVVNSASRGTDVIIKAFDINQYALGRRNGRASACWHKLPRVETTGTPWLSHDVSYMHTYYIHTYIRSHMYARARTESFTFIAYY